MSTKFDRVQLVGVLLMVGGMMFVEMVHIAELTYPNYSVSANWFSDLGQTCSYVGQYYPHDCVFVQPAATIFNGSIILLGLMLVASLYLMWPVKASRRLFVLLGLSGIGCLGVGFFPEGVVPLHALFAMLVFATGAIAAIESFRFLPRPAGYVAVVLGCISLLALAILIGWGGEIVAATWTPLGLGGMERMTVYPELIWLIALGAAVIAKPDLFTRPSCLASPAVGSTEHAPGETPVSERSPYPPA